MASAIHFKSSYRCPTNTSSPIYFIEAGSTIPDSLETSISTLPNKSRQRAPHIIRRYVAREALLAPVSGVIAAANAVAGQVVDAREVIFEVIDPVRLEIEALAYDAALPANIAAATLSPSAVVRVALTLVGAGRLLKEGAIPVLFRVNADSKSAIALATGQTVKVFAATRTKVKGHAIPAAAVVKNPSNQDIVWVRTAAECFVPQTIRWVALDGARVAVLDGLKES